MSKPADTPSPQREPSAAAAASDKHYNEEYFSSGNYAVHKLGRFSMNWFAIRYYAALTTPLRA